MTQAGPATPLGIIAGRGALPRLVAEARAAAGLPYVVIGLDGFVEDWVTAHPHEVVAITGVRRILGTMAQVGCTHVTMAGGVQRPKINLLKLDTKALSWMPKILPAMRRGDDALLRTVRQLLEAEGLELIGPQEIVTLTSEQDVPTRAAPTEISRSDVIRGEAILAALAPHDVGQGLVVCEGLVLGIETVFGTDAMLDAIAAQRTDRGGVLIKRLKQGQDRDMDMPAIGPDTVASAVRARLDGIVIEAGGVLILEHDATLAAADAAGLFIWIKS